MTEAPSTTTIPEVGPELGLEVPVSRIDKELRKLWEQDEARTNASAYLPDIPAGLLKPEATAKHLS